MKPVIPRRGVRRRCVPERKRQKAHRSRAYQQCSKVNAGQDVQASSPELLDGDDRSEAPA